ncbi:MAG: hypothetical protein HKO66_12825 [Saprospiraceae bacterium]|nr:hypothetical protein [Saprospiraceae bacterium]
MGTKSFRRQMMRDLRYLNKLLSEFKEGLIPFEEDEFKLLAAQPVLKKTRKTNAAYSRGVLSTIYQEPLIAFSLKESYNDDQVILLAQSKKSKYRLTFNGNETEVMMDGSVLGHIDEDNQLIDPMDKKIAFIDNKSSRKYARIMMHDKDVAHINVKNEDIVGESTRVFSLFHDFNEADADEIILLTLYYLFIKKNAA